MKYSDNGKRQAREGGEDMERKEDEGLESQERPVAKVGANPPKKGYPGRPSLTRVERAKIRILDRHGVPRAVIATMIGRCSQTISNMLLGRSKRKSYDDDDDYDYVDAAFTAKFPPASNPDQADSPVNPQRRMKRSASSEAVPLSRVMEAPTTTFTRRITRQKRNVRTVSAHVQHTTPPRLANTQSASAPVGRLSEPIDLVSNDGRGPPDDISTSTSVTDFLSCLAHDIAWVQKDLEKQDLGSMEKLLAIADWPQDDLHMMFREALPEITVPQRFILVKGLKRRYEEIIGHDAGVL